MVSDNEIRQALLRLYDPLLLFLSNAIITDADARWVMYNTHYLIKVLSCVIILVNSYRTHIHAELCQQLFEPNALVFAMLQCPLL